MSQDKDTDEKLSKVIESLNLHKLLPEIYNVSSAELRSNSLLLGDRVIVGRFAKENNENEAPAESKTEETGASAVAACVDACETDLDAAEVRISLLIILYAITCIRHFFQ